MQYALDPAGDLFSAFLIGAVPGDVVDEDANPDRVSSRGPNPVTLCSQGDTRVSNRTSVPRSDAYIPYPCDVDWTCGSGLGIAFDD
jgi:hypothetical protein